ncbi:hypothetical protein L596_012492 [Steinernema carpocapsae]|uniref:Uncharacterized protein n=1 Tax=Steinernema carpocapsae TaxID=34508 RepID=A0A4U5NXK0_STECR|nr:hypothetical protein L596_012492 [Steinernema carpocapsae]
MTDGGAGGLQEKCSEERKRRGLSAHCIVEIVKKGKESNQEPVAVCPMDPPLNRQHEDIFKYVCCCTGDLCNVAQAREILLATRRTHESKEAKGVSSKKACPDNEFEHHFAGKGCVKYWHDKQQLNLIENHNFVIKDYIEFGKFSNCSLVEIEFPSTLLAVQKCAEKHKYMKNLTDRSLTVIMCKCAAGKCDRKDQDLSAIDTISPCNHLDDPILESQLAHYTVYNNNYTAYCSVAGIYSSEKNELRKTFQGSPEVMKVDWMGENKAEELDLLKPGCGLQNTGDGEDEFKCTCQSKSSEPCNDEHLLNKVVNLFYNHNRTQEDLDDESKVCKIDGVREVCIEPGCFIVEEPQEDGSSSFKSGCIYRTSDNEEEDRYARDLCQLTGVKNDCHVIVPSDAEKHVLCCCEGVGCNSEEFSQKRKIQMKTLGVL